MPNWLCVKGTVTGPPIVAAGTSCSGGLSLPYRYATTSLTPPSLLPFDPRVNMPVLPTPSCHMLSSGYWVDVTVGAVFGAALSTVNSHGPPVGELSIPSLDDADQEYTAPGVNIDALAFVCAYWPLATLDWVARTVAVNDVRS